MKIAVSTDQGYVSAHFGRCPSYTMIEVKEGEILSREEIPNPGHQPGFLPQYLSEKGVNCIIAGGMGHRAQVLFAQHNIETVLGVQGKVDEVIKKFLNQELEAGEDLCGHRHGEGNHAPHVLHAEETRPAPGSKICITSKGKDLEAEIDPRFGRAAYFLLVDPETREYEAVNNPHAEAAHGAGTQAAQLIAGKHVGAVFTGNCGPNAMRILQSAGIHVTTGAAGKIKDVLSTLKSEVKS